MSEPVIAWEPFATFWPDAEPLATRHFHEVEGDLAVKRPLALDVGLMTKLNEAGILRVAAARVDGRLAGYCTWSLSADIESMGLTMANQGAIYVDPEFAKFGLGYRMLKFSIPDLKAAGVNYLLLHHRMLGRGKRFFAWFRRLRAVLIKHEYYLWIGD